jgi:hypothetical protein
MINQLLKKIELAARGGEIDEVTRLSTVLNQAKELAKRKKAVVEDEKRLQKLLSLRNGASLRADSPATFQRTQHGPRGGLIVEFALPKQGRIRLEERTAAATLTTLLRHLVDEFGSAILPKLRGIRTARGPLVSSQPKVDFLNPRRNQVYASHRIAGTEYDVITHSSTAEKVEHVQRVFRAVGIEPHSYRIETRDN